jgi:hypothetical protein
MTTYSATTGIQRVVRERFNTTGNYTTDNQPLRGLTSYGHFQRCLQDRERHNGQFLDQEYDSNTVLCARFESVGRRPD